MEMKFKAKDINEKISENYTKVKIGGLAEIVSGENIIKCRNKFTRYLMAYVVLCISTGAAENAEDYWAYYRTGIGYYPIARVGTDTVTATTPSMDDLAAKINVAPSSWTVRAIRDESIWLYAAEFVFTWNAGVLPDTDIGEIGVFSEIDDDTWSSPYLNPNRYSMRPPHYGESNVGMIGYATRASNTHMIARVASADGAFDAFYHYGSIDPLTFKWRFQVMIL